MRVGLLSERATVTCDPSVVSAERIAECVQGLGYTAEVLQDKRSEEGTLDLTVSRVVGSCLCVCVCVCVCVFVVCGVCCINVCL